MKKNYQCLILILLCAFASVAQAQTVNLQFSTDASSGVIGDNFEVFMNISGSEAYEQGGFNIRFTYDSSALGAPVLAETYNFNSAPYSEITLTYSGSRVSVNGAISMGATGSQVVKEPEWTKVLKLRFKILDHDKTTKLEFLPSSSEQTGTVVMNQNTKEQLETGNLYNLNAPLTDAPLPVSLVHFAATWQPNNQVLLTWTTAAEKNNKEFQVQRSQNGKDFETVAVVAGAGDAVVENNYSAIDAQPLANYSYYRLKQVDFGGKYEYSKLVSVKIGQGLSKHLVKFGPNPFQQEASISFNSQPNSLVQLTLTDINGRILRKETIKAERSFTQYSLQRLDELAQGVYLVKLSGPGIASTLKVVKE
ncbi:T9SS type A sorting domain-containing protein [Rufibacter roseus]|uniref:T9SS type A sorting domain-containing protein n=1 Tax=Rufibacter roseus TaxID=1567108 RepID=A0ABW2DNK3_9BACT|nr:T9SS type A sorting domain-containing protein [Rufibacter roseus]